MIFNKPGKRGFSLVEVALALAIAAVALVSVLGLVPTVMRNHQAGSDQLALGTIYEDLHDRIEGNEIAIGPIPSSPFFYDSDGHFVPPQSNLAKPEPGSVIGGAFFRAEASLVPVQNSPGIHAMKISIFWPLSDNRLPLTPDAPGSRYTYVVTPLTGKDWEEVDSQFKPTIEY